jgi:DNA-directed RNA polymerase specialized sigma24 family protein
MGLAMRDVGNDPAEKVARIAASRRGLLLRVHRRRLRWEDLEDCYSQATLELVTRSRRAPFLSNEHVLNALEQKFLSRIEDRRRAIGGRSPIESAIARAVPVDIAPSATGELEDPGAAIENQVIARTELRRVRELIGDLSRDQRLVLASEVCVDMGATEFCARFGWSLEKYRKVAQRARAKLRVLLEEYERGERCRRLEPDLLALSAGVAEGEALARARAHVANCTPCARMLRDLDHAAHSVAVLLPVPAVTAGIGLKLAAGWAALRRVAAIARHPLTETGANAGAASGGLAGAGVLKIGLAAVCVAGAAGSFAVCARVGLLPDVGLLRAPAHALSHRHPASMRREHPSPPDGELAARSALEMPALAAPSSASRAPRATRLSDAAQIELEFGQPQARAASVAPASPSSGALASASPAPPQTPAQISQTKAEFGFEK